MSDKPQTYYLGPRNFSERLLSRKFWLAIAVLVTFVTFGRFDLAANVAVAYLAAQGWVDGVEAWRTGGWDPYGVQTGPIPGVGE